jgi:hypothetical protein
MSKDLTNKKINNLKVIKFDHESISKNGYKNRYWLCKCDLCKKEKVLNEDGLRKGITYSCGCERNIKIRQVGFNNKKYNRYDLTNDYGIGYTSKNEPFYFDLEDYDKIKDICWFYNKNRYIVSVDSNKKRIYLHRIVMNKKDNKDGYVVDHINRNTIDNRKENLRICTISENGMNKSKKSNNSSGHKGVWYNKRLNNYVAELLFNHKKYTKSFAVKKYGKENSFKLACKAQEELELKYFKEYSVLNSTKNKENSNENL